MDFDAPTDPLPEQVAETLFSSCAVGTHHVDGGGWCNVGGDPARAARLLLAGVRWAANQRGRRTKLPLSLGRFWFQVRTPQGRTRAVAKADEVPLVALDQALQQSEADDQKVVPLRVKQPTAADGEDNAWVAATISFVTREAIVQLAAAGATGTRSVARLGKLRGLGLIVRLDHRAAHTYTLLTPVRFTPPEGADPVLELTELLAMHFEKATSDSASSGYRFLNEWRLLSPDGRQRLRTADSTIGSKVIFIGGPS